MRRAILGVTLGVFISILCSVVSSYIIPSGNRVWLIFLHSMSVFLGGLGAEFFSKQGWKGGALVGVSLTLLYAIGILAIILSRMQGDIMDIFSWEKIGPPIISTMKLIVMPGITAIFLGTMGAVIGKRIRGKLSLRTAAQV